MTKTRLIALNGLHLNAQDEGSGPPVLLIHGFPDDLTVWRHQVPALVGAGYRVIAPDMRGYGLSDAPPERRAYHMDHLLADLIALLDHLGLDRVRLVGHDWGAVIGWQLAIRYPARILCYAALSVGHPMAYARAGWEQKKKGYYILIFQIPGLAEWFMRRNRWRVFRRLAAVRADADHWIAQMARPGRLTAALNYYRANFSLFLGSASGRVSVPVMGLYSDGDMALAEDQMINSAHYVDAPWRYHRIAAADHWLQVNHPDTVNPLLIDFLGDPALNRASNV